MAKPPSSELNWSPRARPLGQLAQVLKLVARMDGALWIQPMSDGSDIDPVGRSSGRSWYNWPRQHRDFAAVGFRGFKTIHL